jgi:hypothetical protein
LLRGGRGKRSQGFLGGIPGNGQPFISLEVGDCGSCLSADAVTLAAADCVPLKIKKVLHLSDLHSVELHGMYLVLGLHPIPEIPLLLNLINLQLFLIV